MEKDIVVSVSPYVQKYYLNEEYQDLPAGIKEEVLSKLSAIAESTNCIISLGFNKDGEIFIEERNEDPMFYDDIGAALEIKNFQLEEAELLKSLKMWYMIYRTQNGQIVRDIVILKAKKNTCEEILGVIENKYGSEGKGFAAQLLEE
ncbi:DUF6145 family protein [Cellulosilyticum sp. I15G10I2]|uniref:DUF6145 family protein n=1 Tax=Cellulosilyticum sp. I15G10I2 TaxID=1892843 RepID=UPI00085CA07A|nr:DUF6145 family protein [Cellulosilyticum sp. I15G10I2]